MAGISVSDPKIIRLLEPDEVLNTGALVAPVQSIFLHAALLTSRVTVLLLDVKPEFASKYTLLIEPGTSPQAGPPLINDQCVG